MKEQFVPYEIALKLRDKGFDELVFGFYWTDNKDFVYDSPNRGKHHGVHLQAPLWQQVIDWFREKHNLIIWVEARYGFEKKYLWFIHFDVLIKDDIFDLHIQKYEEARQAAIEHALTLI